MKFRDRELFRSLTIAFLPIGIFGLLFGKFVLENLFDTLFVGLSFIVGALLMLHVEFLHRQRKTEDQQCPKYIKQQCYKNRFGTNLSLNPGFSRSGAAIIGGMYFGLNRSTATNFSFLLAVPVILSATIYSLYLKFEEINIENIHIFVIGFFASFASAFLVIKFLISYLKSHSLIVFAVYRILAGALIILFGTLV